MHPASRTALSEVRAVLTDALELVRAVAASEHNVHHHQLLDRTHMLIRDAIDTLARLEVR